MLPKSTILQAAKRRRAGRPERSGIYRNLNTNLAYLAKRNAGRRRRDRKEGAQILESIYI